MGTKHDDCIRGFTILSEAYYAKACQQKGTLDEIMVGMYHPDCGTTGEFGIRWKLVGNEASPRLEVFNDAWDALQQFGDLLKWMASVDGQRISPQEFAEALRGMGIIDRTERANPHSSPAEREYASWFQ